MKTYSIHNIVNFLTPYMNHLHFIPNLFFQKTKSNTIFLLYHSVSKHRKSKEASFISVSYQKFCSQMEFLYNNKYKVLSVRDWHKVFQNQKRNHNRTVVLTFDDGYSNHFHHVCPILKKYGFKATFYPIFHYINSHQKFPWLQNSDYAYDSNFSLNSKQIRQMDEDGMEIGSHTLSHKKLSVLSKEESWKEINESKNRLEDILGHSVSSFSYPYGAWSDFNPFHKSLLKRAGYKRAVTSIYGANSIRTDKTMLKRIPIYNQETQISFAMKVEGYYNWIGKFQWFLSNIRHHL